MWTEVTDTIRYIGVDDPSMHLFESMDRWKIPTDM